jgi:hypothetical protein
MAKKPKKAAARRTAPRRRTQRRKPKAGGTGVDSRRGAAGGTTTAAAAGGVAEILAWEDDPRSGAQPVRNPVPDVTAGSLPLAIDGAAPAASIHSLGTSDFRYWSAASALRRGADFWTQIIPAGTIWQRGATLDVLLDAGVDLNAYYDRRTLSFFHDQVGAETIYSGESPDIVCHELGHAILDAIRPELWAAASDEAAAFHESFGDISAILCALQIPALRTAVLQETDGKLYRNSRLSRIGEQLGWALNQRRADQASPDALRNASNSFFYTDSTTLAPSGPDSQLTSQPHSFSRVFTGGFFDALSGIFLILGGANENNLLQASRDAARLIVDAVVAAPIVPDYFSQVAAHLLEADTNRFAGKYHEVIKSAFVRRGILSLQSAMRFSAAAPAVAANVPAASAMAAGAAAVGAIATMTLQGDAFGLAGQTLVVQAPVETKRLRASAAALDMGSAPMPTVDRATRAFLEGLFRRGRVDFETTGDAGQTLHPGIRKKTHFLVKRKEALHLERRFFDCGFDCGCPWP